MNTSSNAVETDDHSPLAGPDDNVRQDPSQEPQKYRRALGQFGTGVTVVTTSFGGANYGMTSNSFASVSLDPPLVLWSIKKSSQSYNAFAHSSHFTVNVLDVSQAEISSYFAKSGGDKFANVDWRPGLGGCPILAGSLATFECARSALHDGGDHLIVVGQVKAFHYRDGDPLLFSQGQYVRADATPFQRQAASHVGHDDEDMLPEFLTTSLRNAYGAMWHRMEDARRDAGITHAQAGLIYALDRQPGLDADRLARQLGFGLNSSEDDLEQLQQSGLVTGAAGTGLRLTEAGERRLAMFLDHVRAMERAEMRPFSNADIAIVKRVLRHLLREG